MQENLIISPIAIDLGSKTTGVYFADYVAGESPDKIQKKGVIYRLEKNSYTYLMEGRTASRHQRRGYQRRKLAKRLFRLIWIEEFGLNWDRDISQSIGFLFNRRGFSYLAEEYNPERLMKFPKEAFDYLPNEVKDQFDAANATCDYSDFSIKLTEWSQNSEKIENIWKAIGDETRKISRSQFVMARLKKLNEYLKKLAQSETIEESEKQRVKLTEMPSWVLREWKDRGVQGF